MTPFAFLFGAAIFLAATSSASGNQGARIATAAGSSGVAVVGQQHLFLGRGGLEEIVLAAALAAGGLGYLNSPPAAVQLVAEEDEAAAADAEFEAALERQHEDAFSREFSNSIYFGQEEEEAIAAGGAELLLSPPPSPPSIGSADRLRSEYEDSMELEYERLMTAVLADGLVDRHTD
mmetsp:Transcript_116012/g.247992  ORF Transcript_116012/g.247992 Transcript_116012/m.247992 type:complete len:177 (-) Transcript_116012:73-603(-)